MNTVASKTERGPQERKLILMTRKKTYQKGSVKLHRGSWTLRYREIDHTTGKWTFCRLVLGKFKDKKDALKASEPIMAQVNERNNTKPKKLYLNITFSEFLKTRWETYTVQAKHQISTLATHNSLIDHHLVPFFGEKRLRDVQPSDISDFLQLKRKKKLSANTRGMLYSLVHLMFDLAEQYDLIDKSPVRSKLHKPESAKVEKPTLSASQIRAVISFLPDEQERLFVLLMSVTGIRLGEALAFRWMDFDATACTLSVNHTLYKQQLKEPKTKSSKSTIKLAPSIAALLLSHKEQSAFQAHDDFIFCRSDGNVLNAPTLRDHLHAAMDKAEIKRVTRKYGFHIFRHSAGTLLYTKSRDLKLVQGTLRHADISVTSDIYVHLDDVVLNEGAEILTAEIMGNCAPTVPQKSEMVS
jgi:integrase